MYTIFADAGGVPGAVLASDSPQNQVTSQIGTSTKWEVWFDLEDPFFADAGVKYWFGLTSTNSSVNFDSAWLFSLSGGFGSNTAGINPPPPTWGITGKHSWFLLSGHPPGVVGGELLPIDTTALIIGYSVLNAYWIAPIGIGIGVGVYLVKRKL